MENLFSIVSKIEIKEYKLVLDKHDIEGIVRYLLKLLDLYKSYQNPKISRDVGGIYSAVIVQVLVKIESKKRMIKAGKKVRLNISPAEFFLLREVIFNALIDDMPLIYPLQVQLDTQ